MSHSVSNQSTVHRLYDGSGRAFALSSWALMGTAAAGVATGVIAAASRGRINPLRTQAVLFRGVQVSVGTMLASGVVNGSAHYWINGSLLPGGTRR